jgi:hypothetical protein
MGNSLNCKMEELEEIKKMDGWTDTQAEWETEAERDMQAGR